MMSIFFHLHHNSVVKLKEYHHLPYQINGIDTELFHHYHCLLLQTLCLIVCFAVVFLLASLYIRTWVTCTIHQYRTLFFNFSKHPGSMDAIFLFFSATWERFWNISFKTLTLSNVKYKEELNCSPDSTYCLIFSIACHTLTKKGNR